MGRMPPRSWACLGKLVLVATIAGSSMVGAAEPKPNASVVAKVRTVVAEMLAIPAAKLGDDTRFASLPRPPDDLDVVEIVLALEDAFAIAIPDAEVERAGAGPGAGFGGNLTVGKLAALVQTQLDHKPRPKPGARLKQR